MLLKGLTQEKVNSGFEKITATIDESSIPILIKLVSKDIYSNPIGSFIREITSNGVDANVANDKPTDPVLVSLEREEDNYSISFKDNGKGMTPQIMKDIFFKWFSSTSRNSEKAIGGFGLGSKSPLAYVDFFELTTIAEGTKYEYIIYKNDPLPDLDLVSSNETDESSGTTVKIQIEQKDLDKTVKELRLQLAYFNNVIVETCYSYYNNNYTFIIAKNFIARVNKDSGNLDTPFNELHISLGQVAYPINFNVLGIKSFNIPIALKFEVGDLDVTMGREEIQYDENAIKLINEKIEATVEELKTLYQNQIEVGDFIDYYRKEKYYNARTNSYTFHTILNIGNCKLNITDLNIYKPYGPFKDFNMDFRSKVLFGYSITPIKNGIISTSKKFSTTDTLNSFCILKSKSNMSKYSNILYEFGYILVKAKIDYRSYVYNLGLKSNFRNKFGDGEGFNLNFQAIKAFITEQKKALNRRKENYPIATPEWIAEYKRENNLKLESSKGKLIYCTYSEEGELLKHKNPISTIEKYDIVFYGIYHEDEILPYQRLLNLWKGSKRAKFILLSTNQYKKIKNMEKVTHISTFFYIDILQNFFDKVKLYLEFKKAEDTRIGALPRISNYYRHLRVDIRKYFNISFDILLLEIDIESFYTLRTTIETQQFETKDKLIKLKIKEYREFTDKFTILQYVQYDTPIEILRLFLSTIKQTKLNEEFYHGTEKERNTKEITCGESSEENNTESSREEEDNYCEKDNSEEERSCD